MRKKLAVLSLFLCLTGSAYGYPRECSLEADKCVLTLIDLSKKLALKVRENRREIASLKRQVSLLRRENEKLKERVKSLEILVDGLLSQKNRTNSITSQPPAEKGKVIERESRINRGKAEENKATNDTLANDMGKPSESSTFDYTEGENTERNYKIYQLATFIKLNPYTTKEVWQLMEKLNSQGIETKVALTRKGYLVLFGKVPKGLEKRLRVIFPDMFVPKKIENPYEFFRELPVFTSYDDFMTFLTQNLSGNG